MLRGNVTERIDRRRKCRRSTSCRCGMGRGPPCGGHKNRKRNLKQPSISFLILIKIVIFHTLLLLSTFFPPKDHHHTFAAIAMSAATTTSSPKTTTTAASTIKRVDLVQPGGFVAGVNLVTSTVPVPTPNNNEVLIDVKASAVNPVDWKQAMYNFMLPKKPPTEISTTLHPFPIAALGCDVAGVVIGPTTSPLFGKNVVTYLGADKSKTRTTRGGFVEQVVADEDLVFEIPDYSSSSQSNNNNSNISFSDATTLPVGGLTAGLLLQGIEPAKQNHKDDATDKNNNWIVIWGTSSSVGWFALQLAKQDGYRVIAVASSKHKDSAMALGADAFIDYRQEDEDIVSAVTKIVLEQDDGINISMNAAIDCIGTDDTFSKCCDIVNKFSKLSSSDNSGNSSIKIVSCTNFGLDGPDGVKRVAVNLGTANETNRDFIKSYFPKRLFGLKPQPTKLIKSSSNGGPEVDYATIVEQAFQLSQNGVSGEKIVIEWD